VYELSDGSGLVLTVGKYVTPNGTDIDREGLSPDFRSQPGRAAAESAIRACRLQRGAAMVAPALTAGQEAPVAAAAAAAAAATLASLP
jgi:C-terminal processing protease CtpA/Prc